MKQKNVSIYFICLFSIAMFLSAAALAQGTTTIAGKVTDASTGENLPGANVLLQETRFGAATDRFGDYRIDNVPQGSYTLEVRYIGYETYTTSVNVTEPRTTVNVQLNLTAVELEGIVISGLRQGQAKALNEQRTAMMQKSVLSREEMEKFPDMNTAEALQRIPGVTIDRNQGEGQFVFIRGTEPRLTGVTVDGQKLASSEQADRVTDLGIINATQLASIEVHKALTPEMDAHGIGGQVNLVTKSAFDFARPMFIIDAGGGYESQGKNPLYRSSVTYVGFLGDNNQFGYTVSGNFHQNNIDGQRMSINYDEFKRSLTRQFIQFALNDLNLEHRATLRNRYGVSGTIEYKPDNINSYYIRGMYNKRYEDQVQSEMRYRFGDGRYIPISWQEVSPDTIVVDSLTIQRSRMDYTMIQENTNATLISAAVGGKNRWSLLNLDYYLHYSYGEQVREDPPRIRSEWAILNRPTFIIDMTSGEYPTIQETGDEPLIFDPANYGMDSQEWKRFTTSNTNYTGAINSRLVYNLFGGLAELKTGAKFAIDKKDRIGVTERFKWAGPGRPTMDQIASGRNIPDFLNGHYYFSPIIDVDKARDLLETYQYPDPGEPGIIADMGGSGVIISGDGIGGIFDNTENIYAFYLMNTFNIGKFMALVGIRNEYTSTRYEGKELLFNPQGDISDVRPALVETDYNNIFPYLHIKYILTPMTNIRAAYTQTIARPNYYDLAPYNFLIPDENEYIQGNPDLEPTLSTNMDFMVEHYFQGIGVVSIGLFYKDIDKFIYRRDWTQEGGEFHGFDRSQPVNAGSSKLYGYEISWQQQFGFLPGFLEGFGIYANYTHTKSEANLEFRDWTVIPGQAGDVGNLGVNYEKYGLTARLSANYRGEMLISIGSQPKFDTYLDNSLRLDFTSVYQLFSNLSIYVNVRNITNERDRRYMGIESRPNRLEFYGRSLDAGLKFSM